MAPSRAAARDVPSGVRARVRMGELLLSTQGRIRRRDVWVLSIAIVVAAILGAFVLREFIGARAIWLVVSAATVWPIVAVGAKRLRDRGKTPWPWLGLYLGPTLVLTVLQLAGIGYIWAGGIAYPDGFVPNMLSFLALIVLLVGLFECAMLPGEPGANRFGPDPRILILD